MRAQKIIPLLIAGLCSTWTAQADWQLSSPSEVTFVSAKNSHLLEVHRFANLSGSITESGKATIDIDLSSIDSRIPIRDQRMRDLLFEVKSYATARIEAHIPEKVMSDIRAGKVNHTELDAKLSLHGHEEVITLKVLAAPAKDNTLIVTSLRPVLIHADDFALAKGVTLLQDIAKLNVISQVVPVSFTLTLNKQ